MSRIQDYSYNSAVYTTKIFSTKNILRKIGDRAVRPVLQGIRNQRYKRSILIYIGEPAAKILANRLPLTKDFDEERIAVSVLREIGGSKAIMPLIRALGSPVVEREAVEALIEIGKRIGKEFVTKPLIELIDGCLEDPRIIDKQYVPEIASRYVNWHDGESRRYADRQNVLVFAIAVVGALREEKAINVLIKHLCAGAGNPMLRNEDVVIKALLKIGKPELWTQAKEHLIELYNFYNNDPYYIRSRDLVKKALNKMGINPE